MVYYKKQIAEFNSILFQPQNNNVLVIIISLNISCFNHELLRSKTVAYSLYL